MTPLAAAFGLAIDGRLKPTDLAVTAGELVALIGPNGGGKTSLLRAFARVEGALGSVILDGDSLDTIAVNRRRQLVSFLPASHEAFWPVPVRDYAALSGASRDAVEHWLGILELGDKAECPIDRLSTGERSRAMLARALAISPRLLLLDEPMSNLEPYWVLRTLEILRGEAVRGAVVLASLHDLHQLQGFDRVLMVANGSIVADAAPADVLALPEFEQLFRVVLAGGSAMLRPTGDPRSLR